ncbi:class E sortase [Arenivirga flava]|uniref:Class E sortase n=1 Tax=Arenivirga flava TaxID=1930060 RepID=A0AA37XBN9_9MICO|nr:class E sortase [Arenivirga flava]GMA28828.1 hypothetical protein GCM10025874_20810 [Arenivirga flava]
MDFRGRGIGVGAVLLGAAMIAGCAVAPPADLRADAPDSPVVSAAAAPTAALAAVTTATASAAPPQGEPPIVAQPAAHQVFATMHVPRFGQGWMRSIGEGVSESRVLNREDINVGHYDSTQMPGQVGNFAVAAHRETHSGPFSEISALQIGDPIVIETPEAFFVYLYRNTEYVLPSGVGVLDATPQFGSESPGDRIITLTSCNPRMSTAERIIAYGVLDTWAPNTGQGMPQEIAALLG